MCWLMVVVSFAAVWVLHCEVDIAIQELATKTVWTYDYDVRNFYIGLWGNVLTGAIVSLITSYVSYNRAKHQIEFTLLMSEEGMCRGFQSITCGLYTANRTQIHTNVCRFKHDYSELDNYYQEMIAAHNDYSPFIKKSKKAAALFEGKLQLQKIWVDTAGYQDDFIIAEDETALQKAIDELREEILKSKKKVDALYDTLRKFD